jgi:hypothetical protein
VTFFAMAGGRLALTAEINEVVALRAHGGVEATLTPTILELNDRAVFQVPPVSGTVGARLVVVLP